MELHRVPRGRVRWVMPSKAMQDLREAVGGVIVGAALTPFVYWLTRWWVER